MSTEVEINLKALKKVDPYIKSIETSCSNVALYNFNSERSEWEKTEVEGTLFLFTREAEPKYCFTIMNRLNPENHVEPVTGKLDFQIQPPFLLYKNSAADIRGIWFFSKNECESVGKKIQLLVKEVEEEREEKERKKNGGGGKGGGGNLSQLLQNAEKKKQSETVEVRPDEGKNLLRLLSQPEGKTHHISQQHLHQPVTEEPTSASVKDFFALASTTQLNRATPQLSDSGLNGFSIPVSGIPAHTAPVGFGPPMTNFQPVLFGGPPVIQALPISQGLAMGAVPVTGFSPYAGAGSVPQLHNLLRSPGALTVDRIEEEQRKSSSPQLLQQRKMHPDPVKKSPVKNTSSVEGSIGDLSFRLKQQLHVGSKSSPSLTGKDGSVLNLLRGEHGDGHTLLSPHVFSSLENSPTEPQHKPESALTGVETKPSISPLTRTQMIEALQYMLETDDQFTISLHQAYICSLQNKFRVIHEN
ncbi:mRNA-decapping enzyme-like protein [Eurytemora carolleeae]|uniref:mRNA-decapping enzyme-like protein n=1 Tax=Eurytemora carolleeae TaxID=1294199 RepID=UPI000C780405|nr:mRNA-decapping enzyme-like protein [Eurytemora carolleeae]|eukprot:XP_023342023.1 mRNA-decapping enzyme-like protein [Eurytemora affinis]